MKKRSAKLIKLKGHFEHFTNNVLVVDQFLGLLDPFVNDFFVSVLLYFESLEGLEFLESDEVEKHETETEHVRLERVR